MYGQWTMLGHQWNRTPSKIEKVNTIVEKFEFLLTFPGVSFIYIKMLQFYGWKVV